VVENKSAEYMMYIFMLLFFIVAMAVSLISIHFSFKVMACGFRDGGLGKVVSKIMLIKVKQNSNDSKITVP
jgi:hypothetical protein